MFWIYTFITRERPDPFRIHCQEGSQKKVFPRDPIFGGSCIPKPLPLKGSNITGLPQAARKIEKRKLGVNKEDRSIKTVKIGVYSTKNWKNIGKNRCKSTKMSEILGKMRNLMPFERVIGPNRYNMENYGDLQSIARRMKPTIWVLSEKPFFWLHPLLQISFFSISKHFLMKLTNFIVSLVFLGTDHYCFIRGVIFSIKKF